MADDMDDYYDDDYNYFYIEDAYGIAVSNPVVNTRICETDALSPGRLGRTRCCFPSPI